MAKGGPSGMTRVDTPHAPVLLDQVLSALSPADGGAYVDGTFGFGGYTCAILDAAACRVFAIDRDPAASARAEQLCKDGYGDRLVFLAGTFGGMAELLNEKGIDAVDGVALDIGVSSMQLDDAERGFSFRFDGPLDMRMSGTGTSAADVVNTTSEEGLANIIYQLGEERASRRVARAIVAARTEAPITRTAQLADIVRGAVPKSKPGTKTIDPATRTFQALRIYVNDELGELDRGLAAAEGLLKPGGRLCVVSFHSLEDRLVKDFLKTRSGTAPRASRHMPDGGADTPAPSFHILKRGAIKPDEAEIALNPRARSARLRWAVRTEAKAWPVGEANGRMI